MFSDDEPAHIKELEWLARYYYQRGFKEKALEILRSIEERNAVKVVEMFNEEERRA